jgi:hypothetical protein
MFADNDIMLQQQVMQKLIGTIFTTRNFAHVVHLNTNKHFVHITMQEFYEGIVDLADELTEVWQGRTLMRIGDIPAYKTNACNDPLEEFKNHLELIESLRREIDEDSVIQSLIDDIVDLYLRTIYKLKFLNDSTPQTMASKTNTSASIDSDVDNDNFFNNMTNTEDEEL